MPSGAKIAKVFSKKTTSSADLKQAGSPCFYTFGAINQVYLHNKVSPEMLDQYLGKGFYRLGPYVFTTDHIRHPEGDFPVVWLRYRLQGYEPGKKQVRLLRALEKFELFIKPLKLTEELERLFYRYKYMVSFDTSFSLQHLLYDEFDPALLNEEMFPSRVVEVRSEGELIAAGIIDMGEKSSAGIVNFYSPEYKKYSLGKALMVKKMMISKELGMDFYYPGYIAYGFPKFDYKLFLGEEWAELFDPVSVDWVPYSEKRLREMGERVVGGLGEEDESLGMRD